MAADPVLRFGRFEIVPAERVLRIDGRVASVGGRAFDLLLALAERRDRVVSKAELLDLVWPGVVVEEHNIAAQMSTLRKLLGANVIATVAGRGYRFVAAAAAAPAAAQGVPRPDRGSRRHNLPDPRTRFIGREAALADLARLLSSTRLLTLTGIGGSGKTRLALRVAQQHAETVADGPWFVDLAPLHDPARVAPACAAVFGINEEGDRPLLARLLGHLAARRTMLVLDNCEHVRGAVAGLVEALLGGSGATTILTTSREALGVAGEQIYPVRSLSLPATDDLAAVLNCESARLFVDRARLARPDFGVDAATAPALAEICRRLDGIALAIELAAARVPMLSLAEIAARLDDRFRLLTGGGRAGVPRHQTLHAAMQWSYEQLDADEQRMLRQVSVFAGGWTLDAAAEVAQVADTYDALARLTALHGKSLIEADHDVDHDADGNVDRDVDRGIGARRPRYRMLETVRQYALDRLTEWGEADAARQRHVAHFIALAEAAEPHVRGADQDTWMSRFRQEHENLVVALEWCIDGPLDPQAGLRLAAATGYYWGWNSVELGWRLLRAVLEHDIAAADTAARGGTLRALARLSEFRGRYEESLGFAQQELDLARRLGEPRALAWALNALGSAHATLGRHDTALQLHEEALDRSRGLADAVLTFTLLNNIASARHQVGELEASERNYREALALARLHVGRVGNVVLLDNLIRVLVAQGKLDAARQFALECLPLARHEKVGMDLLQAVVGLASCRGEHLVAARFWGASDQQLKNWGYRQEPGELEFLAPLLENSRRALGAAAFADTEAQGRTLPFDPAMLELQRWLARDT